MGLNAEIYDQYGHKKFYGNTDGKYQGKLFAIIIQTSSYTDKLFVPPVKGIVGMDCMEYTDTFDNNIFELALASPVLFADPANLDFHLQASSPAINTGVALANDPPIGLDFNGVVRVDPMDQGAFEYFPEEMAINEELLNP